jgi:single-stranded DNA-binding protein
VYIIGELIAPVEIRRGRVTGRSMGKTMIAVARGTKGSIDFVPVTLRDREAEMASRYLGDGSLVAVEGHLRSAVMADLEADERPVLRRLVWVIADRVTYLRLSRRGHPDPRPRRPHAQHRHDDRDVLPRPPAARPARLRVGIARRAGVRSSLCTSARRDS